MITTWFRVRMFSLMIMLVLCFAVPLTALYSGIHKRQLIRESIALHIKSGNEELATHELRAISRTLYETSRQYGMDYRLILALMKIESNFQHDVVSPMGARGLLQIKPSFAKFVAQDIGIEWDGNRTIDDPRNNIKIGVRVLSEFVHRFNDVTTALRAYNMGPEKTRGLSPDRMASSKGFPGLVLREYNKNIIILPDP
ncbi:MAG: transglycosylase SLT domain-containing protein [Syntrophorhabdaceae bacterium]